MRGRARTPSLPIVAPTEAMPSGVARSRSWPIALAPTARSSLRSLGRGIEFILAAGTASGWLNPNASAADTRRLAPSFAPSGANTELQDSANDVDRLPPHDSSLALRNLTPESTANWRTG